jgi:hypothetical protein
VFVTGIDTRWINVRHNPIARPAKPFGARSSVAPKITNTNTAVNTTSVSRHANNPKSPGDPKFPGNAP